MKMKRLTTLLLAVFVAVSMMAVPVFADGVPMPKTTIKTLEAKNYGFKVTWAKKSDISGYQIKYSTSSSFKNSKTITVKGKNTTYKTVKKLKRNTKYYVRVRTYWSDGNSKQYSKWSDKKSVTTKKSPIKSYIKGTWKAYKIEADGVQMTMKKMSEAVGKDYTFKLVIGSSTIKAYTNGESDGSITYTVKDSAHIKYSNGEKTYTAKVLSNGRLKFRLNDDAYIYLRKI